MRTRTCLVGNQKGGVGKTTITVHLAAALAERQLRVLVLDLDSGAGATAHLGAPTDGLGSFELLTGAHTALDLIRRCEDEPSFPPGVDLLPASGALEALDAALAEQSRRQWRIPWECLVDPLREIAALERYDWVLVDAGPNKTTATRAAYLAVGHFLAVVEPNLLSELALASVIEDLAAVRARLNPGLHFLGAVLNGLDRRHTLSRGYRAEYQRFFAARGSGDGLLHADIPIAQGFENAQKRQRTLFQYEPKHRVLVAVRAVAEEFLARADAPLADVVPIRKQKKE